MKRCAHLGERSIGHVSPGITTVSAGPTQNGKRLPRRFALLLLLLLNFELFEGRRELLLFALDGRGGFDAGFDGRRAAGGAASGGSIPIFRLSAADRRPRCASARAPGIALRARRR